MAMANLCPNLESLCLHLCGQITTDAIIYWGKTLHELRHLELFGPFLVRKDGWISFFESVGARLESFLITQSPRIDLETIEAMIKHCPNIAHLRLAEIGQMSDVLLGPLAQLNKLISLELSSPGSPLSDDAVIDLIKAVGPRLERLNLSDTTVSDAVLPAIAKFCPNLRSLSLNNLDFADEGVSAFFTAVSSQHRPGFQWLEIEKGHHLHGTSLRAIIAHSGKTLEHLSIMGWKEVENEALQTLRRCDKLERLNIGWCRAVTDFTMKDILEGCESIKEVRVWGELVEICPGWQDCATDARQVVIS
jgi:DNA repair protein RAD7